MKKIAGTLRLFLAVCLVLLAPQPAKAEMRFSRERQLQAAFFHRFLGFLEWEGNQKVSTGAGRLCVLGDKPITELLQELVLAAAEPIDVLDINEAKDGRDCSLVFIGSAKRNELDSILRDLAGSGAVTVSDIPHFIERGGIIQFVVDDSHVKFIINYEAAKREGVKVSSQLLALAKKPK